MTPALTCNELRPLLGGYVFEALEPDEAEAVRAHLPGCPACAAELASLAELPQPARPRRAGLAPGRAARASTEEALLDRVARESDRPLPRAKRRRLPRFEWTRPRVAIASALIAAAWR
jgi:anti-sigma factor RsiW